MDHRFLTCYYSALRNTVNGASRIREAYKELAKKRREEILEEYKESAEKAKEDIISNAHKEANEIILRKKAEAIRTIRKILLDNFDKIENSESFQRLIEKEKEELKEAGFKIEKKEGILLYATKEGEEYILTKEMLIDRFIDKIL